MKMLYILVVSAFQVIITNDFGLNRNKLMAIIKSKYCVQLTEIILKEDTEYVISQHF